MKRAGGWVGGCEIEEDVVRGEVVAVINAGDVVEVRMDEKRGAVAAIWFISGERLMRWFERDGE